jgi:hypothetical protein
LKDRRPRISERRSENIQFSNWDREFRQKLKVKDDKAALEKAYELGVKLAQSIKGTP